MYFSSQTPLRFNPPPAKCAAPHQNKRGEVPEWSNGAVSKTVEPARVPWVRIPPSPPYFIDFIDKFGDNAKLPTNYPRAAARLNGQ